MSGNPERIGEAIDALVTEEVKTLDTVKAGVDRVVPDQFVVNVTIVIPWSLPFYLALLAIVALLAYLLGNNMEKHLPLIVGLVLAGLVIPLPFFFKQVTALQRQIILAAFALAGGGIASEIPGFIKVDLSLGEKSGVAAGGALAIFVLLYFFPAQRGGDR